MDKEKVSKVLDMIAQDMKDDAKNFDGQPFTGRTVAEYFGNQGAAIAALANIVKDLVNEEAAQQSVQPTGETAPLPNNEPDIQELIDDQVSDFLANR